MFFSGDPTSRKRVDMGGRSNKERDRQVLLEQTREERRRRLAMRLQNSSATKIQVCPCGWSVTRDRDPGSSWGLPLSSPKLALFRGRVYLCVRQCVYSLLYLRSRL
jgi:hypothetical protein